MYKKSFLVPLGPFKLIKTNKMESYTFTLGLLTYLFQHQQNSAYNYLKRDKQRNI